MKNLKAELLIKSLEMAPDGIVIEVGCIREDHEVIEDGWSTVYLARECEKTDDHDLISCDTDAETVKLAKKVLRAQNLSDEVVEHRDGLDLITSISEISSIALLFLDGHKYPSFTLDQYKGAKLLPGAVLIIDDCQPIDNFKFGKAEFIKILFDKYNHPYEIVETCSNANYTWASLVTSFPNGKKAGELI